MRAVNCLLIALASPRRSELEALDWTDVDLARETIRIPEGKTVSRMVSIHPVQSVARGARPGERPGRRALVEHGSRPASGCEACRRPARHRERSADLRELLVRLACRCTSSRGCSATRAPGWSSSSTVSSTTPRSRRRSASCRAAATPVWRAQCRTLALQALEARVPLGR